MRRLQAVNVIGIGTATALVAVWELSVGTRLVDYDYLPAPSAIARGLASLAASGELAPNVAHTLGVTLLGWLGAALIGVLLGLVLGLSRTAWRYSMASIEVMRTVPPVTLVPVAVLAFGFSRRMELTIVVFVGVWPVLVNTIEGVRSVPRQLVEVARVLRMGRLATVRKIVLPAALPSILVGLRLALSLALVLAVVSEMIGNPSGLGNAVVVAQQALQPAEMFAYVVAIGMLGVALNATFSWLSASTEGFALGGPPPGP